MDDRDGEVRKRDTRVQGRYRRVVPLDDLAKEDPRQDRAIQLQSRRNVQVVRQDDGPDARGNMEDGCAHGRFLLISEERVGSPEVDGLVSESLDATTRADAVVVDADAGGAGICVEHLGVEGVWEGCAGPGQFLDGRGTSLRTEPDRDTAVSHTMTEPHRPQPEATRVTISSVCHTRVAERRDGCRSFFIQTSVVFQDSSLGRRPTYLRSHNGCQVKRWY